MAFGLARSKEWGYDYYIAATKCDRQTKQELNMTATLKRYKPGQWIVEGFDTTQTVYAVRVKRLGYGMPDVWELQYEDGSCAFGDAFEGLSSVRAYLLNK